VQQAQAHVAAVTQATAVLQGRVESMDGEVGALVASLQAGAGRLAADLGSVETNMGELYDAASGRRPAGQPQVHAEAVPASAATPVEPVAPPRASSLPTPTAPAPTLTTAAPSVAEPAAPTAGGRSLPPEPPAPPAPAARPVQASSGGDLDGARLVALNMALNGESREQADRYLSENFQLADRERLLDEVYAAIEV
jgi:hypothetical protein